MHFELLVGFLLIIEGTLGSSEVDTEIGTSKVFLCFRNGEPILNGYKYSNTVGDVDSEESISGFLMTFAGGAISWQSNCRNVLHYPPRNLSTLLLLRVVKNLCGWENS